MDWRTRERQRLETHVYKPLIPDLAKLCPPDHYAHVGKFPVKKGGDAVASTIAFTKTEADGLRDIQRRMRVARYLIDYCQPMTVGEALEIEARQLAAL